MILESLIRNPDIDPLENVVRKKLMSATKSREVNLIRD
jgi:hypothetical protein